MPTSFRTPVVRPRAEVRAEAALGAAPAVVGEADRASTSGSCERDRPADERQPQAAVVDAQRAGREQRVDELAAAVEEAARVAAGRAVLERQLDLLDAQPRADARRSSCASRSRSRARAGRPRRAPRADNARWPDSGSRGVEAGAQRG